MLDIAVQMPTIETESDDMLGIVKQKTFFATNPESDFYLPPDFPFQPISDQSLRCMVHVCLFQVQHDIPNMFCELETYIPTLDGFSRAHYKDIPFQLKLSLWRHGGFFVKGNNHAIYCGQDALTWEEGGWKLQESAPMQPVPGDLILMYYHRNR